MFLTSKQEIPAALVMLVVAIAIVNTAVEICPESRCPGPLPQMQQIVEGDRVIEYFFNSSLYITNINWCINGTQATNPTLFREKIMKNFSTNVLVYTNPSREDRANGLTLYAIEGESNSDCAINTNLITVQSNVGNISARLVLIHIVEASCPVLHHPVNGKVVHVTDRTANYSCNPGFNLNGNSSTITCVTKVDEQVGEWIGSLPTCEPVTCERPTITNGTVDFCDDGQEPNRTSFGAIATFKCDEGYILSDSTTLRCTYGISTENSSSENGNWNSCNPGFSLIGNSTITYVTKVDEQVGEWIGSPPTCEPVTCERPTITNGTVDFCGDGQEPNRTSFGAIATFKCNEGYILSDNTTLRCTYGISTENSSSENGNWSSTLPTCEPITCERPPIINGTVEFCGDGQEPNRISFGAIATFHCDEGYILSDNTTLRCTYGISTENSSSENGNWSSTLPTCEALQPPTTSVTPVTEPRIKITDPEGISIVLSAFIVGLVLGVLAASVVCYVCVKRTPTIHPITSCTMEGNLNRNDVLNGHNDYQMDGIEDSQKQDS